MRQNFGEDYIGDDGFRVGVRISLETYAAQ
jgi:hypothetical protein